MSRKQWFRIVDNQGSAAFVLTKREEIREFIARMLKPIEIAKLTVVNDDTRFEAYCRALADGDKLLDAGEADGSLDVGSMKFRFVAL